jgi:hypothetical protein
MGSAVDQMIHDEGTAFARVRERALAGTDERLAYFEWSLPADTPDLLEAGVASDVRSWARTNPALGVRISPDYVEAEQRELDPRTFAVERLGVGDWPPTDGSGSQVIPLQKWDALTDDPAADGARMLDPVCLAFDVTPDRSMSAIAVVGRRDDGLFQVELTDHHAGTRWLPERLHELWERHDAVAAVCDATGPAGSLLYQCEELGVPVETVSAPEHAKACGRLFDMVEEKQLRHLGAPQLRDAVRGATARPLGDAWAWSRKSSSVDISPLVAATLALWAAETQLGDTTAPVIW